MDLQAIFTNTAEDAKGISIEKNGLAPRIVLFLVVLFLLYQI